MPDAPIDIDYAGWAQAGIALIAIAGGPPAFQAIYTKIRTKIAAVSTPLDSNAAGGSMFWRVSLKNKRKIIVRDTIWLYPAHASVVVSSIHADQNDGGRFVQAEIVGGGAKFTIERLGKGRVFEAIVGLSRQSYPIVESDSGKIPHTFNLKDASKVQILRSSVAVSQYRLMVFMFQFIAGFGVILFTLIRQRFWS